MLTETSGQRSCPGASHQVSFTLGSTFKGALCPPNTETKLAPVNLPDLSAVSTTPPGVHPTLAACLVTLSGTSIRSLPYPIELLPRHIRRAIGQPMGYILRQSPAYTWTAAEQPGATWQRQTTAEVGGPPTVECPGTLACANSLVHGYALVVAATLAMRATQSLHVGRRRRRLQTAEVAQRHHARHQGWLGRESASQEIWSRDPEDSGSCSDVGERAPIDWSAASMNSSSSAKNTINRLLLVFITVLSVLLVYQVIWDGAVFKQAAPGKM